MFCLIVEHQALNGSAPNTQKKKKVVASQAVCKDPKEKEGVTTSVRHGSAGRVV